MMLERTWKRILRRKGLSLWGIPALGLWVVSLFYRLGVRLSQSVAEVRVRVRVPVLSVGNITVGGTGKTPLVALVASRLIRDEFRVGVVSSGWGRGDDTPFVEAGYRVLKLPVSRTGDEVMLLAELLPEAWFAVHRVKAEGARALAETGEVDVIIVDDGYQHRELHRDLDLVTYDGAVTRKFLHMFPYGLLREPMQSLKRADVIVITRANFAPDLSAVRRRLGRINPQAALFHAQFGCGDLVGRDRRLPLKYIEDKSVFLFAGVGNFKPLRRQVQALAGDLDYALELSDHQEYDEGLLGLIKRRVDECDSDVIVTTGKDWVKLGGFDFGRETYYLAQTVDVDPGEEKLMAHIIEHLRLQKRKD
jgi:tetraacyldisaccharide 4'-kinase